MAEVSRKPKLTGPAPRCAPAGIERRFQTVNPTYPSAAPVAFGFAAMPQMAWRSQVYDTGDFQTEDEEKLREERAKAALSTQDPGQPVKRARIDAVKGLGYFVLVALVVGGVGYIFYRLRGTSSPPQ